MTQLAEVLPVRPEVIVDEDAVRLVIRFELRGYLAGISHSIGHAQAISCQEAEPAPIVTTAGGNQTGGGEKKLSREDRSPWGRVLPIGGFLGFHGFFI